MKYWSFKNWAIDYTMRWLTPKISIALPTATLTAVIFSLPSDTKLTESATNKIENIFSATSSPWFSSILFLSSIAKTWSKGRSRKLHLLTSKTELIAKALNIPLGMILVPLVVAMTSIIIGQHQTSPALDAFLATIMLSYLLIGTAVHLLAESENFPYEAIIYTVWTEAQENHEEFNHRTSVRLSEVLSHVQFLAEPITSVQAAGGFATIVVPSYLCAKSWKKSELVSLQKYLHAIELEWRESAIRYKISQTPNLESAIAEI